MPHLYGDEHVRRYRETDGEEGFIWKKGSTILILTTKGAKTGEPRDAALIFREDEGRYVIVASKGGHPQHPGWYANMRAHPEDVEIQVKADRFKVRFHAAQGEERARLWKLMTDVWPEYDDYQARTNREIPVVVLERVQASGR